MTPAFTTLSRALATGAVAGVGGGLASLGGGTLVIPLLMGWLGLAPLAARGTAMAVSLFSAVVGSLVYAGHGMLDLPVAVWVAVPSFLLAPLLAKWSEGWPARRLKAAFGLVVMIGGVLVIARDHLTGGLALAAGWQTGFLLLVGVHGAPVLAARLLPGAAPLDGGRRLADGRPLLGSHKTWRGVAAMLIAGLLLAPLLGLPWPAGLVAGSASAAGDLATSFLKRRLGLSPGTSVPGLDQLPEVLLPLLAVRPWVAPGLAQLLLVAVAFVAADLLLTRLGRRLGLFPRAP